MKLVSVTVLLAAGLVLMPASHWAALASENQPEVTLSVAQVPYAPLGSDPLAQADQYLVQAQLQLQEMLRIAQQGGVPGQALLNQLQTSLNYALHLAAGLSDEALTEWLNRANNMVQEQRQALYQAQTHLNQASGEPLRQAYLFMSQVQLQLQAGRQAAQTFRHAYAYAPPAEPQPMCDNADCQLQGDQHQYGPQPDQPGPGQPGGNPDGTCTDCQPQGDQHQYGPQPDQPGPGQPGGNPDGTCDDCQPQGDQHQYGPQPDQPGPGQPGGNPDGDGGSGGDADQGQAGGGNRRGG